MSNSRLEQLGAAGGIVFVALQMASQALIQIGGAEPPFDGEDHEPEAHGGEPAAGEERKPPRDQLAASALDEGPRRIGALIGVGGRPHRAGF